MTSGSKICRKSRADSHSCRGKKQKDRRQLDLKLASAVSDNKKDFLAVY